MSAHSAPQPITSAQAAPLKGEANVPGDKSISHRSLILGALSVGETRIRGLLEGEDVLRTADAMRAFGAEVANRGDEWSVHGVGVGAQNEELEKRDGGPFEGANHAREFRWYLASRALGATLVRRPRPGHHYEARAGRRRA